MTERKLTLQESAMRYGTGMGLLWSFKFMLFPLGLRIPFLLLLFMILTLGVPILGYVFTKRYRERQCEGSLNFGRAFFFIMFMYMFASLFVSVTHYIYFNFIDDGFIFQYYQDMIDQFRAMSQAGLEASIDQLQEAFNQISQLTALEITLQLISNNIFYGMLMALPTALLVMRKKKNQ